MVLRCSYQIGYIFGGFTGVWFLTSYQYFDFPEDGEKIDGMILGVPRKDIPETKYYDDDIMDFNKLPIDLV